MHRLRRIASGLAVGAMIVSSGFAASAQSTPNAGDVVDPRVQLAAVTPGAEDLPTGYVFLGETFLDANQVAASGIDGSALTSGGFMTQYVSVYTNLGTGEIIRSYASLWSDDNAATNGFALMEDEGITNPDDALTDSGTDVGEEPRETTTGTYTASDGETLGTVDVTFRRGPMVIGVAYEKPNEVPADGAIATDVAARADARAQAILNGEALPHIDLSLPGRALSFGGEGNGVAQAGFLGPIEVESIYGVQGSLLSGVDSSWVETTMIGSTDADAPTVTVGLTTFSNPQDALFAAEQADNLFEPLPNQEAVEGVVVEGADAASAYRYSSDGAEGLDSYRLIIASGGIMTVVDVQGATANGGAELAATAISMAQLACQSGGPCETPALPAEFTGQ